MKSQRFSGLILPEHQPSGKNTIYRAIGYILRGAVALLCAFAMSRFVFDAMEAQLPHGYVFGVCLALTALFSLMAVNKTLLLSGALLTVCTSLFALQSIGSIVSVCRLAGVSVLNAWCRAFVNAGYRTLMGEITDISSELADIGRTETQMLCLAAFFIMMIFAAISVFAIIRRAKPTLVLCVYIPIVTVTLYLEIIMSPIGILLMLAAMCAAFTLGAYDGAFCKRKLVSASLGTVNDSPASQRELEHTLRANSCLGGYAGALSALAALTLIYFISGVSVPMKDIPKISMPAEKIQNFLISSFESRESSISAADSSVKKSRKTTATERLSSGTAVFEVQTDINIPIYLRSWTGKYYYNDGWYTATDAKLEEYRDIFGSGFSHEFLTSELILAIDPTLYDLTPSAMQDLAEFGFVSSYVHITKKTPSGSLVYMPSYTDQRTRLLNFGSKSKLNFGSYQNYYDGIFVSSSYIFTDRYTVLARLGLSPTEESAQNIARLVQYYAGEYEILRSMRALLTSGKDISEVRAVYPTLLKDTEPISTVSGRYTFPTEEQSLSYRYAFVMDKDERLHIDALTDNLSLYQSYVYDNYLEVHEHFDPFNGLMHKICEKNGIDMRQDAGTYAGRHRIVSAAIDYLSENMTYTLSPKEPNSAYLNAAATFVFDTKEGYCSQYASAAIMMLRSAGIPARYAEGYVATEFKKTSGRNAPGKYISYVTDSNAHAWVEVYFDYYGWVTYEATAPFAAEQNIPDIIPEDTTAPTTDTTTARPDEVSVSTTAPADSITSDTQTAVTTDVQQNNQQTGPTPDKTGIVAVTAILLAAVAGACVVIAALMRRIRAKSKAREELIRRARAGISDITERITVARDLGITVMELLSLKKLVPDKAEPPSVFAVRVDLALEGVADFSFKDVMRAMSAAEFSDSISEHELLLIADAADCLRNIISAEMPPPKRAIYKYFGLIP